MRRCNNSPIGGRRGVFLLCLATFTLIFQIAVGTASAQIYTLSSGNSSVTINDESSAGIDNWTVDGQNQLNQQWFWYRTSNSGPASPLDALGTPTATWLSPDSILSITYANAQFSVTVLCSLVGGTLGSGASDLSEQISIKNLGTSKLSLDFFQYADFNLGGTPNNDTGQLDKMGSKYNGVVQYNSPGCMVAENVDTAVSQAASYGEIGTGSGATSTILNSFANSGFTHLNDQNDGPPGGANINWGLEWDASIAGGGTYIISKDLNISGVVPVTVPEPSTWSLILLGMISGGMCRFRSVGRAR
jgi:hypothetical protein